MSKLLNKAAAAGAGTLGPLILTGLARSISWQNLRLAQNKSFWADADPGIGAFWHGQQLVMPWLFLDCRENFEHELFMLISQHRDGRYIAAAMERLGIKTIAGSSTRGGKEAMFKLAGLIRGGNHVGITPDGPKGPRHKVKQGIIRLAQFTGCPIHPCAVYVKNAWEFSSWDRMRLPKPLSRGARSLGDPIYVPRKASDAQLESCAKQLQDVLIEMTEECKSAVEAN